MRSHQHFQKLCGASLDVAIYYNYWHVVGEESLLGSLTLQVALSLPGLSHEALTEEQLRLRCVMISNALLL